MGNRAEAGESKRSEDRVMERLEFAGVREDFIHWSYWDQVIFIEEGAKRLPVQRLIQEVRDVQNVWDEAGDRINLDGPTLLDLPKLVLSRARAA